MLLPGTCAAIHCPWCGLQTTGGDACDMCRRPLRQVGYVHAATYMTPQDRSIDWARILAPAGIIASLAFGFVLFTQLVGYGRRAAQPRTLPPVKSASQLPGISDVTRPMQGYADLVKKADASTTPEDDSLRREKDLLLQVASQRFGQQGGMVVASNASPPTYDTAPTAPQRAGVSGAVLPYGEELKNSPATTNGAYIESVDTSGEGFNGPIFIVNPTDREIETFDLTLQVGERVFPLELTGQAADTGRRAVAPHTTVQVNAKAQILGPAFGPRRVVLRILYTDRAEPEFATFKL